MHNINKPELISKVLINVLFISLFIAGFFFTYGSYIEKKVVINQMLFLSKNIKNSFGLFGEDINESILTSINDIKLPDLSHEDNKTIKNNKKVKIKAFNVLLLFALSIGAIVFVINKKYGNSYKLNKIIFENLMILIAVGLTEFVFLTYFGARYISINPNVVKLTMLESLKENEII